MCPRRTCPTSPTLPLLQPTTRRLLPRPTTVGQRRNLNLTLARSRLERNQRPLQLLLHSYSKWSVTFWQHQQSRTIARASAPITGKLAGSSCLKSRRSCCRSRSRCTQPKCSATQESNLRSHLMRVNRGGPMLTKNTRRTSANGT